MIIRKGFDMTTIILAILLMANGEYIRVTMPDRETCISFTRAIASHVESANCFTIPVTAR